MSKRMRKVLFLIFLICCCLEPAVAQPPIAGQSADKTGDTIKHLIAEAQEACQKAQQSQSPNLARMQAIRQHAEQLQNRLTDNLAPAEEERVRLRAERLRQELKELEATQVKPSQTDAERRQSPYPPSRRPPRPTPPPGFPSAPQGRVE